MVAVYSAERLGEAEVTARSRQRGEPDWLTDRRLAGWKAFENNPMPKLERTTLQESLLQGFRLPEPQPRVSAWAELPVELRETVGIEEAPADAVVLANGYLRFARLSAELAEKGVFVGSLAEAAAQRPDLVRDYVMGEAVPADSDKPWALNGALWGDGLLIYVPEGVEVKAPLQAFMWGEGEVGVFDRTVVVAAPNSDVTVVETVASPASGAPRLRTGVVEVYALDGARIKFCALQTLGHGVNNLVLRRAVVGPNASVQWIVGEFGSSLTAGLTESLLQGRGGESSNVTVFFAGKGQHLDVEPRMFHTGTHTQSNISVKGVVKGGGRAVYAPVTSMEDQADEAAAFQKGTTLILDPESRAYSMPQLFVAEEQVAGAGHAATIGQVDPEHIFYLRSRGLTEAEARRLLVHGFFHPVIDAVPVDAVKEQLTALIDRKLDQ